MSTLSMLCWIIWIRVLLGENVVSKDRLFMDPPTIEKNRKDDEDVMLWPQYNSSLTCFSEYPITWTPFKGFTGSYKIEFNENVNDHPYESTIHLINISHHFVGYFYCVTNITQNDYDYSPRFEYEKGFDNPVSGLSKIYVFVNEDKHLLAPVDLQNGTAILRSDHLVTLDYQYLLVPCKPTSQQVTVLLFEDSSKELKYERFHGLQEKIGMLVRFSSVDDIYGRTFTCKSRRSDSNSQIVFNVRYHVPKIESATGSYGTKDEHLDLNCSIVILKGETIAINWKLPNALLQGGRVDQSPLRIVDHPTRSYLQIGVSEISIRDLDIVYDEGDYECEAIDELQSKSVDRISIEILEKSDDSVDINALDGLYRTEISEWETVVWKVKYKGHPKPSLEWYDTSGKIIYKPLDVDEYNYNEDDDYEEEYSRYEVDINNQYAILKIRFVRFEYSGFYTLKAANEFSSIEKKFELRMKLHPQVVVNNEVVSRNENARFVCNCTGYPPSTITWTFTPCDLKEMQEIAELSDCKAKQRLIEPKYFNTTSPSLTTQTSVLVLNATTSETGKVKCTGVNTEGRGSFEANLHVTDIEGELFSIWGLNGTEIIAGDNVTVFCAVSVFAEAYVQWFRNDKRINDDYDDDDIKIDNFMTGYTREGRLSWTGIKTSHSGTYECRMDIFRRNSPSPSVAQFKILDIKIYEPRKPEVDHTITPEQDDNEVEKIRLTCNFVGHPLPELQWFKNGELITNDTKGCRLSVDIKTLDINKADLDEGSQFKCVGTNRFGSEIQVFSCTAEPSNFNWIITWTIVLTLVVSICTIYAVLRFRKLRHESDTAMRPDIADL